MLSKKSGMKAEIQQQDVHTQAAQRMFSATYELDMSIYFFLKKWQKQKYNFLTNDVLFTDFKYATSI